MTPKITLALALFLMLWSCTSKNTTTKPKPKEKLWELKEGVFTQWYPGKKIIKFKGTKVDYLGKVDTNGVRQGRWVFNNDKGKVRCIAMYQRDTLDGHQVVMYPNGINHYIGEWKMGKKDGTWQTFNRKGELTSTQIWKEGKLLSTDKNAPQSVHTVK
ncbi:MAG: toxin-antitoxin system YwqK family antitoxin [Flavobacteriales bacterium]